MCVNHGIDCRFIFVDFVFGIFFRCKQMADYCKWDNAGVIVVTGLENIGDIDGHKELEDARKLGQEI